jgi:hypothetical protein
MGGYLYWDNARYFETTDDAFIAARQFAIAHGGGIAGTDPSEIG